MCFFSARGPVNEHATTWSIARSPPALHRHKHHDVTTAGKVSVEASSSSGKATVMVNGKPVEPGERDVDGSHVNYQHHSESGNKGSCRYSSVSVSSSGDEPTKINVQQVRLARSHCALLLFTLAHRITQLWSNKLVKISSLQCRVLASSILNQHARTHQAAVTFSAIQVALPWQPDATQQNIPRFAPGYPEHASASLDLFLKFAAEYVDVPRYTAGHRLNVAFSPRPQKPHLLRPGKCTPCHGRCATDPHIIS